MSPILRKALTLIKRDNQSKTPNEIVSKHARY